MKNSTKNLFAQSQHQLKCKAKKLNLNCGILFGESLPKSRYYSTYLIYDLYK